MSLQARILVLLASLFILAGVSGAGAAKRIALVIGNADYKHLPPLRTPHGDADKVAELLRAANFEVFIGKDLGKLALEKSIRQFLGAMEKDGVSLLYYSGHAVQVAGHNHIIPVSARVESTYDLDVETMNLSHILKYMRENSRVRLVFLDACRDNPFKSKNLFQSAPLSRSANSSGDGLAAISGGAGTLIAFSTEPGAIALDGKGGLSPFTRAFVSHARAPAIDIRRVLSRVRRDVLASTAGQQIPWENSSLIDDFFLFAPKPAPIVEPIHKVTVTAGREMVDVGLPEPVTSDGGKPRVVFDKLPDAGSLYAGDEPVKVGEQYQLAAVRGLRYAPGNAAAGGVHLAPYRVVDAWGNSASGAIVFAISQTGDAPRAVTPAAKPAQRSILSDALVTALRDKADKLPPIFAGVGAQPLQLTVPDDAAKACHHCLKLAAAPSAGQLQLSDRTLSIGDRIDIGALSQLAYGVSVAPKEKQSIELHVLDRLGEELGTVKLSTDVKLHPCDLAAGEPLDLQGVGDGVLANEIQPGTARAICLAASADHPAVPRFIFQYARAEYAAGNADKARQLFELAAKQGHIRAYHKLGKMYEYGAGVDVDLSLAAAYFEKAAVKGDPYGLHSLGKLMFYGRGVKVDREEGLAKMLQAAEMGHTFAMNELGAIFRRGDNVKKNANRAVTYFSASTLRNDIYGFNNLALVFLNGDGVPKDYEKALTLFVRAHRGGHPRAANNIGRMYYNGWGTEKNIGLAASWYEIAAWRGSGHAANNRAWIAYKGEAGPPDRAAAALYYGLAVVLDQHGSAEIARRAYSEISGPEKLRAIQQFLKSEGAYSGAIDGQIGPMTLSGLAKINQPASQLARSGDIDGALISLARQKWLKGRPRFDLL